MDIRLEQAEALLGVNPDSARLLAEIEWTAARKAGYVPGMLKSLFVLSKSSQVTGKDSLCRVWAREGRQLAEKHADAGYLGKFLGQLGSYYATVGEMDSAVWYMSKAGLQFLQAGDSLGYYKAMSNKATALMRANMLRAAVNDFLSVFNYFSRQKDTSLLTQIAMNLAPTYDQLGMKDSAGYYFSIGEKNLDRLIPYHQFSALLNLAIFNEENDRIPQALAHYEAAAVIATELGIPRQVISITMNKGILEKKLKNFKAAEAHFDKALGLIGADSLYVDLKLGILEDLTSVYVEQGRWEKAYQTHLQAAAVKENLLGLEKTKAIADLEAQYDRALDQRQIAEQQLALNRERSRRSRLLLILTALGLLAAVFIFFLWKTRRQKKTIETQHDTLRMLYGDLQHRTKNYLQTVGAMLNLHSAQTTDAAARRLLSEEQRRVETIKLLEQKLMQEQRPASQVKVHEYLDAVLDNLSRALGAHSPMLIVKDLQPLEMDMEQAMSIGLIVNELVMNASKYAGTEGVSPKVSVSLHHTDRLRLVVEDNGGGLPADFNPESGNSFGLRLAQLFAQRLGGTLSWKNNPGARFEFLV
jgi:two-component sensor histidine kinase